MYKKIFFITMALAVICLYSPAFAQQEEVSKEASKEEIIAIATAAVKGEGITLDDVAIIYDDGNKLWEENIGKITVLNNAPNYGILKKGFLKNYRTVYFDFKEPLKDIWVFVDKDSGEVLEVYRE